MADLGVESHDDGEEDQLLDPAPDNQISGSPAASGTSTSTSTTSATADTSATVRSSTSVSTSPARLPSSSSGGPAVSSSNESATQIPTDYHSLRPWTRLQSGIIKPFKRTDGTIPYGNFCSTGEPEDLHEALGDAR